MHFGEAQPLGAPPVFPKFPLPPGDNNENMRTGHQDVDNRLLWESGNYSALPNASTPPIMTEEAHTRREEYANEAIRTTAEHWVNEQASRRVMEQVAGTEANAFFEEMSGREGDEYEGILEFLTGSPNYLWRVILLLVLGFFGAIPLMSSFAFTILMTGCIVTYAVDFAGYRRGCVMAIISTTGLFSMVFFFSNLHTSISSVGPLCMIISIIGLLFMMVMTVLLHFHWLQLSFPELICLLERCVLGVTPFLVLPSLLSTVTALVGSRHAPAWFMMAMCIIHHNFYGPLESSFLMQRRQVQLKQKENDVSKDETTEEVVAIRLNGRIEARVFTFLLLFLPVVLYISFQSSYVDAWFPNTLNAFGMLCGPVAYLCWNPKHSLWFMLPDRISLRRRLELDPLGIHETINTYRRPFLIVSVAVVLHWSIYRLLHSRYGYLFNGVPPPFNGVCLALAIYAGVYAVYQIKTLLDADKRGEDIHNYQNIKIRVFLVGSAALSCIFLGISVDLPGIFIILMILCVTSLNVFLLDRLNAGSMMSFTVFSSLLLMWWMFRMFSFIVLDLHVLGEATTVPTPIVAMSVLWCYVLSCIAFTVSFLPNKAPFLITLFFHSLHVAWVEHVLYSQKEENVYPAVLVPFTSVVGVLMASRLYKNETLGISEAALIAASYIAKLPTFLVEVTGSYYLADSDGSGNRNYQAIEIGGSWWSALFAGYVVVLFEMERRQHIKTRYAKYLIALYTCSVAALTACTVRNFQRAVFEFLTQSRLAASNSVHIVLGTAFVFFGVVTLPFFTRHAVLHTFLNPFKTLARGTLVVGIIFLVAQPTRIIEHESEFEFDFIDENVSRYCSIVGMILLVLGRLLPMTSLHLIIRVVYWLATTLTLSVGVSMYVFPIPTLLLFLGVCSFVFFSLMTLDVVHYRNMSSNEGWIVYGLSICFMFFTLVIMGRIDVGEHVSNNPLLIWDIYTTGRTRLLSVLCITSLFIAILLRFRLSGRSLLPGALPLTSGAYEQAGVVTNYAAIIFVVALTTLNVWRNVNEPGLHVVSSLFMLLLVDDGVLFSGLSRGYFRYFPVLTYAVTVLWASLIYESFFFGLTVSDGLLQCVWCVLYALPVVPSHVSLLLVTWLDKKRGGTPSSCILLFVALDILCLLLSSRKTVQWMAIVGVCGQCARLFEAQFWRKRLETIL